MPDGDRTGYEEVSYGGAKCSVWPRGDGRWAVSWRELGKARSTTAKTKEKALKKARLKVRELAAGLGTRAVSVEEAEVLQVLYRVCGDRAPVAVLGELEEALRVAKGVPLTKLAAHWRASGMCDVTRVTVRAARNAFLDEKERRSVWTKAGLRKELDAFWRAWPESVVADLTAEELRAWVWRKNEDGAVPGAVYVNNRLDTWGNFFNWCRDRGYWPRGEKHPAEQIARECEPEAAVTIWSPATARAMLEMARERMPRQVPYLIMGCWLGLRPTEETRVRWELFDWQRRYLHCDLSVAKKKNQERFVPLNETAFELLKVWLEGEGLWAAALAGELRGKCCLVHDREYVSKAAREMGIIEEWPQDVMRHSWISYMIASGQSKHEVAEWAGNSEAIIRRKYRRPLMREDGVEWFGVKG